nr:hypothetical protein [Chlamydiota bacterium]
DNQKALNQGKIIMKDDGGGTAGIWNFGQNAVIINEGLISVFGTGGSGILNDVGTVNTTILNTGTIMTKGEDAVGIENSNTGSTDNVITNTGTISTVGKAADGILNVADRVVITNSGMITTDGQFASAIANTGDNVVIENSGSITKTQRDGDGIQNTGSDVRIFNSGSITTSGDRVDGIEHTDGDNVEIINTGLISASGSLADGIEVFSVKDIASDIVVTNSGTIKAANENGDAFALSLQGTDQTLNLLRGSNLQGRVKIGKQGNQVLNVETGLNLALTISGSFTKLGIEAPFVQMENVIGVVDPTGFALQPDVLADLSDAVLNGIYRHQDGCNRCGCGLWAQGIGSYRKRGHEHEVVGYDNWQGGFLLGYDTFMCGGYLGVFGGATFGRAEVDEHTQRADINSYVGGITYEGSLCNTYIGLAVVLGYVDWDNDRFVMNNLAEGGVERAHADLDGFFVSPEITIARRFGCFVCEPVLRFTARYAGLFFGDYQEKGSLTNLSVKDREVDLLTTRFEAAIPYCHSCGECCLSIEPYVGVFGRYQLGGNHVDAELLEEKIDFNQGGPRNLAAFLLGFRGVQSLGCMELFLNLEASFDNESSSRILGEGGLAWRF